MINISVGAKYCKNPTLASGIFEAPLAKRYSGSTVTNPPKIKNRSGVSPKSHRPIRLKGASLYNPSFYP